MIQFCAKVQKPYVCPFLGPFCPKSREWEFSQIWNFHRKLANHKTLHFRSLLARTNDSILCKSPKTLFLPYFCPFLGPFCPKSREREFSQIWDLRRKLANHITLHFRSFLAKTNDSILRKSPKTLFFQKMRICPKNPALSLLCLYGPLTSCKISEKLMSQLWEKCVTDGRTDWLTEVNL